MYSLVEKLVSLFFLLLHLQLYLSNQPPFWDDEDFEIVVPTETKTEQPKKVVDLTNKVEDEEVGKIEKPTSQPKNTAKEAKKNKLKAPKGKMVTQKAQGAADNATPEERKLHLQRLQVEADLDIMGNTFGEEDEATSKHSKDVLSLFQGESLEEFQILAKYISKKLEPFQKDVNFTAFVGDLLKGLTSELDSGEVGQLVTALSVISNEKINSEKDKKSKKKKT